MIKIISLVCRLRLGIGEKSKTACSCWGTRRFCINYSLMGIKRTLSVLLCPGFRSVLKITR